MLIENKNEGKVKQRYRKKKTEERKKNKWDKYLCMTSILSLKTTLKVSPQIIWNNATSPEKKKCCFLIFLFCKVFDI